MFYDRPLKRDELDPHMDSPNMGIHWTRLLGKLTPIPVGEGCEEVWFEQMSIEDFESEDIKYHKPERKETTMTAAKKLQQETTVQEATQENVSLASLGIMKWKLNKVIASGDIDPRSKNKLVSLLEQKDFTKGDIEEIALKLVFTATDRRYLKNRKSYLNKGIPMVRLTFTPRKRLEKALSILKEIDSPKYNSLLKESESFV